MEALDAGFGLLPVVAEFEFVAQRLIEHEPARTRKATHLPRLLAIWHQFVLIGLKALHGSIMLLLYQ